jgi:hypothetical protein
MFRPSVAPHIDLSRVSGHSGRFWQYY